MTEWHGGKGSRDRTRDRDKFNENFDRIFGKNRDKGEKKKQMSQKKNDPGCIKIIQKRTCNGEMANCTPTLRSPILMRFRCTCGCAVAHTCTYAHAPLKALVLLVRAAVRTCISIENYRKVCINIHLYLGEIVFSSRNLVRI